MNASKWIAIHVVGFIIFATGYVTKVYETEYFLVFTAFCMLYGLVVLLLLLRSVRK